MQDITTRLSSEVKPKLCECGCGNPTPPARQSDTKRGHVKGQPVRFIRGHNCTVKPREPFVEPSLLPGFRAIQLTQGKFTIVDVADYAWLSQWVWFAQWDGWNWYAARNGSPSLDGKRDAIRMHREILGVGTDFGVDHIDGDGLNNTRNNLRPATSEQNQRNRPVQRNNTSGYKGVTWQKDCGKWRAAIRANGKRVSLGLFSTAEDAARAYDVAAIHFHGEFAKLNLTRSYMMMPAPTIHAAGEPVTA